ncbi:deoxyuridine 5'-triphosphate nucleotidohydrolase [Carnobacterium iners]|uniref:dUTP diphosphatase n=1 Tax=Carnobacterium iners TaxID=1073423 RepID=A0A1X7MT69_9LACT|nr:dUTP diphosphatase [Carnobacterium iners]SEL17333.1 deoxyuridine 5'-triphosphate nucleotidohydrolase [Carnobacterium iners]SMH27538.1 deoxyuridine 5'-triphosphate nucleotidohydrolase [Carnobacterium iners]
MNKQRGFEIVTDYQGKEIKLPIRATYHAAGYDFEAAEDCLVPCIWKALLKNKNMVNEKKDFSLGEENQEYLKSTLVPTGIKAYMGEDEFLQLANRSSNPIKNQLLLPNGIGIIDSDYYNNKSNEGQIYFQFINYGIKDRLIKKGDRIGQGIFLPFLKADNERSTQKNRLGGFGSSGK